MMIRFCIAIIHYFTVIWRVISVFVTLIFVQTGSNESGWSKVHMGPKKRVNRKKATRDRI